MRTDVREALRSLLAAPGFTAVVVLTLALAIGVNATIFSVLYGVLLRPLDYADPDRLVTAFESNPRLGQDESEVALATWADWRAWNASFEDLGAWRYRGFTLTGETDPERVQSVETTPSVFAVLGVAPEIGRVFRTEEEAKGHEHLAMLSHGAWTRRFGASPDVIGRTLRLDDESYEIVGVMPASFQFPAGDATVEVWTPLTFDLTAMASRPHRMYRVIGRLRSGVSIEQARQDLGAVAARIARENPATNEGWGARLVDAREEIVGPVGRTLWVLFAAVVLVLVIACANIANLVLARSAGMARGFAVRAAFGAGAWVLIRRSLAETGLLAAAGGLAGFGLAFAGIRALRGLVPANVPRADAIGLDPVVLGFTAGIAILAGALFGLVPAIRAMRPNVLEVLQDAGRGAATGRGARRLSNVMVVAEVALALVLVIGAGLLIRSFVHLTSVDPGFSTTGVVATDLVLPDSRYPRPVAKSRFYATLLDTVRGIPGIDKAGAVSVLPMSPLGNDFGLDFTIAGLESTSPTERPRAAYRGVLAGYFEAMGIRLVRGRDFNAFDGRGDGQKVTIINETLALRYFGGVEPIDRMVRLPMAGDLRIVGIVADTLQSGLGDAPAPQIYVPYFQLPLSEMQIVARTALAPAEVTARMKTAIAQQDPQLPIVAVRAIGDLVSASVAQPRFNMALLAGLALSAALLAAVGVYGVVTYSVTRRTAEIGIRMALGSDPERTFRDVVTGALRVVLVGILVGGVAAAVLSQWLQALLYGVSGLDLITYGASGVVLAAIGLLAASLPALRASRIDPVVALRE
ncbi:MAG: ABC transporter permease [Vicinamibacterales bacterium]